MADAGQAVPRIPSVEEDDNEKRAEAPSLEPPAVEGAANGLAIVYINICYP